MAARGGTTARGSSYPNTTAIMTRRRFLGILAIFAVGAGGTAASRDPIPDISSIRSQEELFRVFKVHNQIERAINAVNRAITFMGNAEGEFASDPSSPKKDDNKLAEIWVVQGLIKAGKINFSTCQGKDFKAILRGAFSKENIEHPNYDSPIATLIYKSVSLFTDPISNSINIPYAPAQPKEPQQQDGIDKAWDLTKAFFKLVARVVDYKLIRTSPEETLSSLVHNIADHHHHLPPIPANQISKSMQEWLKKEGRYLSEQGEQFIYSLLFTITALETRNFCDNPTFCLQGQKEVKTDVTLDNWPNPVDKSTAFGRFQFVKNTFGEVNKSLKQHSQQDLVPTDSQHQQIAATYLLVKELMGFINSNSSYTGPKSTTPLEAIDILASQFIEEPSNGFRSALFEHLGSQWEPFKLAKGNSNTEAIKLTLKGLEIANALNNIR